MNTYRIVETQAGLFRIQERWFFFFWVFELHVAKDWLDDIIEVEKNRKVKKVVWP